MSYLDHIRACNNAKPETMLPFAVAGTEVGRVRPAVAEAAARHDKVFRLDAGGLSLDPHLDAYDARTQAVDGVLRDLGDQGLLLPWRGERYPVVAAWGAEPFLEMERAAVPAFGVRAFGVHVNGYVRREGGGIDMWIGRRGADRAVCPGMLDNMVAGGQPVGLSLAQNVIKEAGEEASVPPALAATAHAVGAVSYVMEADEGLKPDTMFCYDMELPDDFTPVNADGEIAEFYRYPAEEVARIVDTTFEFKFNCNLVIIDFLIRHGVIPPEHPDYMALLSGLRR